MAKQETIEALKALLQSLLEEGQDQEKEEPDEYEPPEMITFEEARRRTGLSRQALLGVLSDRPEAYIMNGRRYIINWRKLCRALNAGSAAQAAS